MEQFKQFTAADFIRPNRSVEIEPTRGCDTILRSTFLNLLEELPDGIAIARISAGRAPLLYVNKVFERLTGYGRDEVLGRDCRYLQANERAQTGVTNIREAMKAAEPIEVTLQNYRQDGSAFCHSFSFKPVSVGGERFYLGVLRDGSALHPSGIDINGTAHIDVATGCLNRQSFIVAVDRCFSTHDGPALIVKLDVVGFHDINAGYGFDVGDTLLHETGRRLKETGAAVVGRMGANEFALAFELPNEAAGQKIAAGVSAALSHDFVVPGASVPLRFAIGYATSQPGGTVISVLRNAGTALHAAKADPFSGPHGFRLADSEDACKRVRMTRELKVGIANNEFVHHFQPQIDLSTGQWVGAEALIRWDHPLFGSQAPGRFIEAAERTGLLLELGERGLAGIAAFARRVNERRDRPLRFSANVSAIEFLHRDMVGILERVLRQTDAQPNWLTLEITESMLLDNTPHVLEVFRRLRDLGVGLSVDDFGTGYASLRRLETLPVTEIKIDRSFVGDLPTSPSKTVIVRAIIDLGRALGLTVVAEGVETDAQRTLLAGMGCPIGQGYLFGRPADGESFASALRNRGV